MSETQTTPTITTPATPTTASVSESVGGIIVALGNARGARYGKKASDPAKAAKLSQAMQIGGFFNSQKTRQETNENLTPEALAILTDLATGDDKVAEGAQVALNIRTEIAEAGDKIAAYHAAQS